MRKEILIAIIVGLSIGLLIAFGAYRINTNTTITNSALVKNPNTKSLDDSQATNIANQAVTMSLTNIENGAIYSEETATINGIAPANFFIAVSDHFEDHIVQVDTSGSFEQKIKLVKGINQILVVLIDDNTKMAKEETFTVVYYPNFVSDLSGS